ncbi:hypothetical protein [Kitasatospora sp. NPDC089509]|uniref:hypothetical protein n=1 Tax=Kitasatospora sp. NPDC089509 TaxID=3364079 RepID=UPI003802DDBF
MESGSRLDVIRRIMPPGSGVVADEPSMPDHLGGRLPGDYLEFIAVYGGGAVDDCLEVAVPGEDASPGGAPLPISRVTMEAHKAWEFEKVGGELIGGPDSILAWGIDSSADLLCWVTSEASADSWPVAVFNRGKARWRVYECGMVDFLVGVFQEEFDECPIGEVSLWGAREPRFLNWREEKRLIASGIHPWNGGSLQTF